MRSAFAIVLLVLSAAHAFAMDVPAYVAKRVPDAAMVGRGQMTFVTMDIYDAVLYAPNGQFNGRPPYALSITYHRDFKSRAIANRSISEIRRQGTFSEINLAAWHERMMDIFPDVQAEMTLTALAMPQGATQFFMNGLPIGFVNDADFTKRFFNIWLGPQTSDPALRRKLLGGS